MKKKNAVKLQKGDKIYVQTTHYTGKIRLIEPALVGGNGTIWLSGVGSRGMLVGCAPRFASFRKPSQFQQTSVQC